MIKETGSPELLSQVLTITMLPAIALNLIAGKVGWCLACQSSDDRDGSFDRIAIHWHLFINVSIGEHGHSIDCCFCA